MPNNRKALISDLNDLDRGITGAEKFLGKVLAKQIDTVCRDGVSAAKKKNVVARRTARSQSRTPSPPQSRNRASSAQHSVSSSMTSRPMAHVARNTNRIVTNKKMPPELNPAKGQRSRSTSVNVAVPQSKYDASKQTQALSTTHNLPSKYGVKSAPPKTSPRRPDRRDLSPSKMRNMPWSDILRNQHKICSKRDKGQWDISGRAKSNSKQLSAPVCCTNNKQPSGAVKQPANCNSKVQHDCELVKTESACMNTVVGECNHFFQMPSIKIPEDSFSSEGTSGFSSNNENPSNITKKSAPCKRNPTAYGARPKSVPDNLSGLRTSGSSSAGSPHKSEVNRSGILGKDVFSVFNPVRTLQFLIQELQGMVQKHSTDEGSVKRVIADMQKALQRLHENEEATDSSSGYTTHSKPHESNSVKSCSTCGMTSKHVEVEQERLAIVKALSMVPALAKKIDERTESLRKKILESKVPVSVPPFQPAPLDANTDNIDNIVRLQRHVETSGGQLEAMCRTMEKTCDSLRQERDELKAAVDIVSTELKTTKSNEQDYITTVNSLRSTLETATRRATQLSVENKVFKEQLKEIPSLRAIEVKYKELTIENTRLKEENKVLPHIKEIEQKLVKLTRSLENIKEEKDELECKYKQCNEERTRLKEELQNKTGIKEATQRLTERLQEAMKERDQAQHEQHMLKIEREKLILLSRNKEEELNNLVKDILNIKTMVATQLTCLKSNLKVYSPSLTEVLNTSSDSDEGTNTIDSGNTLTASFPQPVCSSPTSTQSGGIPPVGEEWNNISTIVPDQTHSSPEILLQRNKREETRASDFKTLPDENWHSLVPVGQGEVDIPEDYPPRPRTALGGPRPPVSGVPIGDNQWVGTAPITQELQNNMHELFQFIHQGSSSLGGSVSKDPSSLVTIPSLSANVASVDSYTPVSATSLQTLSGSSSAPSSSTSKFLRKPESSSSKKYFQFEMPKLPDPPKFLDAPEFSEFSSYPCSLSGSTSSIESIDAMLKKLQSGHKRKSNKNGK